MNVLVANVPIATTAVKGREECCLTGAYLPFAVRIQPN
jgi:hypothetical protein